MRWGRSYNVEAVFHIVGVTSERRFSPHGSMVNSAWAPHKTLGWGSKVIAHPLRGGGDSFFVCKGGMRGCARHYTTSRGCLS
ncbi:hypothetical protein NPIL_427241 [Nephila pilipes]|uniref:Uncharacterized protein n=1 Tax=Nephila pilipes TaxID=299642 RepID=A0A8X6U1W0_NEPPI|nr:hypothetical protein NPIL_216431 [Nephila pilipes]GFT71598.1 hypothetical protein NPIL_427241 [Nephila pilipes]